MVATPIGNLGDITLRAVETLRAADVVAAEDTRNTRALLSHLGISARLVALHEHNERRGAVRVVEWPREVRAIEKSGEFKGHYHVLMGRLSPLSGVEPRDLPLSPPRVWELIRAARPPLVPPSAA